MQRLQRVAWMLILVVDVGYLAWGAGAAAAPDHLLGPGGQAILPAGYEGAALARNARCARRTRVRMG